MKYIGGLKDHILSMSNMNAKLTIMDMGLPEQFLVHLVFKSLPPEFSTFEVNYNSLTEKWYLHKLAAMCVQEEERLKQQNGAFVNYLQDNEERTFGNKGYKAKNQHEGGPSNATRKSQGKAPIQQFQHQPQPVKKSAVAPNQCLWCKETGNWQKDCPKWMKHMLTKGEDIITFVDETLYLSYSKSTWWIDLGATVHVANSMQGMHSSQILQRGRRRIKVANGVEAEVEAIGEVPIKLHDGFILHLHDVLFVPSLNRNLISVSCLADSGFECHFGAEKCLIKYNNKCAGLALRQDKLYKLSMHDEINVCDGNVCETPSVTLSTNEKGK
jgi:hypothetical protein